ncbi:tetratricopeptide repeat protein [Lacinutrix iliipiscaria]|uniref:Tetratricopeptide repeat protein n=1 Tax=Lacinutrix iliipiscaria TaxID=1230532 RepID=A0ABW5WT66_9FLAO
MSENKEKKSNRLVLFEIIVSVLFSEEKAKNISETTKLGKKYRVIIITFLVFAAIVWLIISSIIGDVQGQIRNLFYAPEEIEFSQSENLKVLILPFHDANDSNTKFKIEEVIENGLSEEKVNYDLQIEIKIDSLSKTPKNFNDALKIGNAKNADFVIFGDLDSESKEYRINFVLTKKFYEFDIPVFIKDKHISDFKKNLKLSKIRSLESLKDEKFIIYNILGFSELKNGNCNKGIELLNQAIKLTNKLQDLNFTYQDNSYYAYYMAECYLEKKDYENALPILEFSLDIDPNNYDSRLAKSIVNLISGDLNETQKEVEYLKNSDFYDKSNLYLFSGFLNLINNNSQLAFTEFEQSALIAKKDSIPCFSEGLLNVIKGDYDDAIKTIDKLEKYYEFAKPISNGIKSYIYFFDGNINNVIRELNKMESNAKKSDVEFDFLDLQDYLKLGFNLGAGENFNTKKLDSIYSKISKVVSNDANQNVEDALKMVILMKNKKDFKMISRHLKSAIKNNHDYSSHYNSIGLNKDSVIKLKKIIDYNKKLISINKYDSDAYSKIANTYLNLGKDLSFDYYRFKAKSTSVGSLFRIQNNLTKRENDSLFNLFVKYNSELKIDSTNYENKLKLSSLFIQIEEYEIAKSFLSNLDELDSNIDYLELLGLIEFKLGNFENKLTIDDKIIKIYPNQPLPYWRKSVSFFYLNDYHNSLISIEKAIDIFELNSEEFKKENFYEDYKNLRQKIVDSIKTTPNNVYN